MLKLVCMSPNGDTWEVPPWHIRDYHETHGATGLFRMLHGNAREAGVRYVLTDTFDGMVYDEPRAQYGEHAKGVMHIFPTSRGLDGHLFPLMYEGEYNGPMYVPGYYEEFVN